MMTTTFTPKAKWQPLIHRPKLPVGWDCQEQLNGPDCSYITFVRWGKIHYKAEPQKIYVVFHEYAPGNVSGGYSVRGGRNTKKEQLRFFKDLKSANDYMIYVMETVDKHIEEVNSPKYIAVLEAKIAKAVRDQERYEQEVRDMLAS